MTEQAPGSPPTRKRIPMSLPMRRLEVAPIVGFHLHWFVDKNVERAIQAGYEFVTPEEVTVNQSGVATSRAVSGNADMGSRVRVIGGEAEGGGVETLTLMKIRQEWYDEDHKVLEDRNASILSSIFTGEQIVGSDRQNAGDKANAYVKTATLLNRPARKSKL